MFAIVCLLIKFIKVIDNFFDLETKLQVEKCSWIGCRYMKNNILSHASLHRIHEIEGEKKILKYFTVDYVRHGEIQGRSLVYSKSSLALYFTMPDDIVHRTSTR